MSPEFDERDAAILAKRSESLNANPINVGDYVVHPDGTTQRVAYVWQWDDTGPRDVQTTDGGSFYLGNGYVSYSGSLHPSVPFTSLTLTDERREGAVWFFHHDYSMAHNGVACEASFRVWQIAAAATEPTS